jgi:hypothetical protein
MKMFYTLKMTFLCAITPVFDDCFDAFKLLSESLSKQSLTDFIHVAISNGKSSRIELFIQNLNDTRFIYEEFPYESTPNLESLFTNLGKRRNHCIKKYNAERFVFLDADLQITANNYFELLREHHDDPLVILTKVKNGQSTLPKFPIKLGKIDISNYSFSKTIAKKVDYPTDVQIFPHGYANDFRFYERIGNFPHKVLPNICAIKDGNKSYTRLSDMANLRGRPRKGN